MSSKWIKWALAILILAAIFYWFPPFDIVALDVAVEQRESGAFNPEAFAEDFWNNRLMKSLDSAVDAATLVAAIQQDPQAAKKHYSRSMGIGSIYYYFTAGVGRVVAVDAGAVSLSLEDHSSDIHATIAMSDIFGNTIRNGTGLLDVNDFPNSQDFNNISTEINRIVVSRVLSVFREEVAVGSRVKFVGCAEIMDEELDLDPLRLVPIVAEVL